MKFLKLTALAIAISTASGAFAQSSEQSGKPAGRLTAELIFASIDTAGKGYVHQGDLEEFRSSVFFGMDSDENRKLTYGEFASWDPGFSSIAEEEGKPDAYTTASKIVFAFWDRDGNGNINESEMRFAMNADFRRADLNDDGTLSEAEFIGGFAVIVAMRAAIRPDL